ncbi:hypothetical protein ACWEQC_35025 [Streptomyces shenzhenensis]
MTGQLGSAAIDHPQPLAHPGRIVAFIRDADKAALLKVNVAEIRLGPYGDIDALCMAMHGADRVLLV